jgi:hypothetical protein
MSWGNRVCKYCYKPYDYCSGECIMDHEDCHGCSDDFAPDRLEKCEICNMQEEVLRRLPAR